MKPEILSSFLVIFSIFGCYSDSAADIDIVNCTSDTACTVKIYRSDCPILMSLYEIIIDEIGPDNIVTVQYDGAASAVICDGSWQSLYTASGRQELENRIACTIAENQKSITAGLELFDQGTFEDSYSTAPSESGYPELIGADESSPYCETETMPDTASSCKWQREDNGEWLVYARSTIDDIKIGFFEAEPPAPLPDNLCAKDINANGSIEPSEYGLCAQTPEGDLCLMEAVLCLENTSDPICPPGGALNTSTDSCETVPAVSCFEPGYVYDSDIDRCIIDPFCSGSGLYNPFEDRCEIVIETTLCPAGYVYDTNEDACIKSAECLGSGIFDPNTDTCQSTIILSCPSGFNLNSSLGLCQSDPACPSGSVYDSFLNVCATAASLTCPSGYTRHGGLCRQDPACPAGGTYNPDTKRCETATAFHCPGAYFTYTDSDVCMANCFITGSCSNSGTVIAEACFTDIPITSQISNCENILQHCEPVFPFFGFPFYEPCTWTNAAHEDYLTGLDKSSLPSCQADASWIVLQETADHVIISGGYGVYGILQTCSTLKGRAVPVYTCTLTGSSYMDLGACTNGCAITQACNTTCPAGYYTAGSLCIANPACSGGGSFNPASDQCELVAVYSCDPGFSYDRAIAYCVRNPDCPSGGVLNTDTDLCTVGISQSCPQDYNVDGTLCTSPPVCDAGFYNPDLDLCSLSAAAVCPPDYLFDGAQDKCLKDFECPNGSAFSESMDKCVLDAVHDCPQNYGYSSVSRLCESYPICTAGEYRQETDNCLEGYSCPYGPGYACMAYEGQRFCNDSPCVSVDPSRIISLEGPGEIEGDSDKKDDGNMDEATGACEGNIYFFNGKDDRCRSDGATIAWDSCCKDDDYLFGMLACDEKERMLGEKKDRGLCRYIGEYCSKELDLIVSTVCIEWKKTYCCFNSRLGRIIQDKGRAQLKDPSTDWGTPKNPNCRGLSPGEVQMLDFSEIDLDEYYPDIEVNTNSQMQDMMNQGINSNLDGINTKGSWQ